MTEKFIRIKIVDDRGRTIHGFSKRSYFDRTGSHRHTEPWCAEGKPESAAEQRRFDADEDLPGHAGRMAHPPGEDGYLPLPGGLPVRMDKVKAMLERWALGLGLVDESGVVRVVKFDAVPLPAAMLRKYVH